jgi:arginine exporter protein ArgO
MELQKKVKTALDETRMLILGSEILLGFELRGAFANGFDRLPTYARYLDAVGLGLMVVAMAVLILPEPYHRIVEGGTDSGSFQDFLTDIADIALLPFALALGIDVLVAAEPIAGTGSAIAAGVTAAGLALLLWYGLPRLRRRTTGQRERAMTERQRHERPETPLYARIEQLLTEARVILPGAQALFGFQLSIVLTEAFDKLPMPLRLAHAVSIGFVALAVMLLMAPAAYHRIVYAGEDTEEMLRTGSVMVTAATLPLALGLAGDIYVVIAKILESRTAGAVAGGVTLLLLLGLWYGYPLAAAGLRGPEPPRRAKPQGQTG